MIINSLSFLYQIRIVERDRRSSESRFVSHSRDTGNASKYFLKKKREKKYAAVIRVTRVFAGSIIYDYSCDG